MLGRHRIARHLVISIMLAAILATVPPHWGSHDVAAQDACTTGEEIRATTCRLLDGATLDGSLTDASASATYRIDVLAPDATLDVLLAGPSGNTQVAVLDWRGAILGEAIGGDGPEARLQTRLALPGTYGVRVTAPENTYHGPFRLSAKLGYAVPPPQAVWPMALASGDGALTGERQVIRTPRGGTPEGGVAVARALRAPPEGVVDDFTLVADVQFEQIAGPAALSIRFRYEPEAGGGTGYVLELDPFGGTATLDRFEEGQRKQVVSHANLPAMPTTDGPNRLILQAAGPSIRVSLDGQPVLDASDTRYPRGLIVVGAVTWSDPVAVTFDHIQVTTPPR